MGWFNGKSSSSSQSSRRRSPSRRSVYSTSHSRHSAPSVFSLGGYSRAGRSSPSVLSSSSSRRARPRAGFIQRIVQSIKRLFRDIYSYARRHPAKVLLMVVVPLLTSGVLQKLLAMIGIRLPHSLGGNSSSGAKAGEGGLKDNINGLMNIAKMFM
ncbi:uncharacterized protein ACLA_088380 [Aspergillus clavatus NRRL 1]|uniref:Uncharacterized protein n=1 Tax=Aspergillus clavatus (strain ATCC 1007 / CBS 513.65 / DSM 816 / NCTC 3887 / NRRL 1 / QM 1276 / 107) TaxID=344612 RepID=A1CE50_ASPCL|nr:uncharacterized protein ACLA_088380 [Aspergillus clavatus NRRL 1]EAW11149.1 conserved hypothetical protein [Aspergillus clavatus NRRL 1]